MTETLDLILPQPAASGDVTFAIDGKPADRAAVIAAMHDGLDRAKAPAIAGLEHLTIDGVRAAVALAKASRAKLLLSASSGGPEAVPTAAQAATIGHLFACELIIWVGCEGTTNAITQAIAARQLRGAFVAADLPTIRSLRSRHRAEPGLAPIGQYKRVGVVLTADCDPRVASQWHAFANEMQEHVRLSVLLLPNAAAANRRGAIDTTLWLTGHDLAIGGLDFATDPPQRCPHVTTLLERNALDLLITIGPTATADIAQITITGPTLRPGIQGQIARSDGLIVSLAEDGEGDDDVATTVLREVLA